MPDEAKVLPPKATLPNPPLPNVELPPNANPLAPLDARPPKPPQTGAAGAADAAGSACEPGDCAAASFSTEIAAAVSFFARLFGTCTLSLACGRSACKARELNIDANAQQPVNTVQVEAYSVYTDTYWYGIALIVQIKGSMPGSGMCIRILGRRAYLRVSILCTLVDILFTSMPFLSMCRRLGHAFVALRLFADALGPRVFQTPFASVSGAISRLLHLQKV